MTGSRLLREAAWHVALGDRRAARMAHRKEKVRKWQQSAPNDVKGYR